RPRRGGFAQLLGRGSFRLRLEVDAATDIAEVEAVKLQRHVSPGYVDQAERGIVEVLIHSIEVESCRFEILIQGYEPVVHVRTVTLGRKRYAGDVFAERIMLAEIPTPFLCGQPLPPQSVYALLKDFFFWLVLRTPLLCV